MTYLYFEISTVLFECLLLHVFFNTWFGTRGNRSQVRIAVFLSLYFILHCTASLLPLQPGLRTAISSFFVFGIAFMLYETTLPSAVYSAILYMALAVVSEYLCLVFLNTLAIDTGRLMAEGNARAIYLVLAKTFHFIVVLISASILRKNRTTLTLKQVAPLLPCLVVTIYICVVLFNAFMDHSNDVSISMIIVLAGILYINGIIIINTQIIKRATVEIAEQKLAAKKYEMQEKYYQDVIKYREETRSLWHDVNKHIAAIEAILKTGDINSANMECEALRQTFEGIGTVTNMGNEALNTILNYNIQRAKEHGISVSLSAQVPSDISIPTVDLSVILGNTFDNSIEECLMLDHGNREIDVNLIQKNNMLLYEIKNPCMEPLRKKAGNHFGYGLKNIRAYVDKNSGFFQSGVKNGYYCVSVRLNCSGKINAYNS